LEDNEPLVVNGFLDFYLTTIIQLFPLTNPQYIDIATKILFHNHAFWESYGRRNEDSGFSSDEEQDALMGDDTKEDSDGDIDDEDRAMVGGKKPKRYIVRHPSSLLIALMRLPCKNITHSHTSLFFFFFC
jgi:hypothetical protein